MTEAIKRQNIKFDINQYKRNKKQYKPEGNADKL